jgi:hypothetical protein
MIYKAFLLAARRSLPVFSAFFRLFWRANGEQIGTQNERA